MRYEFYVDGVKRDPEEIKPIMTEKFMKAFGLVRAEKKEEGKEDVIKKQGKRNTYLEKQIIKRKK